jgi:uncharacterized membrane protein YoaK (UPF0700 family)
VPTAERALPALLLVLTLVTGLVDAVSLLSLDKVFVANMTGNMIFLGFALVGVGGRQLLPSLLPLVAFILGALAGGRIATATGERGTRLLATTSGIGAALTAAVVVVEIVAASQDRVVVALLAIAMGMQNAAARHLAVPDLPTTVATMNLTGLVAQSRPAGGSSPRLWRRLGAVLTIVAGAVVGAVLLTWLGRGVPLGLAALLLAAVSVGAIRIPEAQTEPADPAPPEQPA